MKKKKNIVGDLTQVIATARHLLGPNLAPTEQVIAVVHELIDYADLTEKVDELRCARLAVRLINAYNLDVTEKDVTAAGDAS